MELLKNLSKKQICIGVVGIVVVLGIAGMLSGSTDTEDRGPGVYKTSACVMAQDFVENNLKAPSTAKFESCYKVITDDRVTHNNGTYGIVSYVDSENSFGATIRTTYAATLYYNQNSDKWTLLDLVYVD